MLLKRTDGAMYMYICGVVVLLVIKKQEFGMTMPLRNNLDAVSWSSLCYIQGIPGQLTEHPRAKQGSLLGR